MAVNLGTAIGYLVLDTGKYTNALQTAKSQMAGFGDDTTSATGKLQGLSAGMTTAGSVLTAGLTLPLVGLGTVATKTFMTFEQQMSKVQAVSGATAEEFEQLKDQAMQLGAETAFSANEAAMGMEQLARAGFTVTETMDAMPGMLSLAAAGGVELASATEIAAGTLRAYQLEATEAARVSDVFAAVTSSTNSGVLDLGQALEYVGPVAQSLSISLEETSAAVGIMSDANIKGSKAGTALRSALVSLAKPTKDAADVMAQIGFNAFDVQGSMLPLPELVGRLQTATSGMTEQQKASTIATIFGTEAMSGMLALVNRGPEDLAALTKELENSEGAAAEMAEIMQDNLAGALEELGGSLETAGIKIGEIIAPAIRTLAELITKAVNVFSALPKPVQTVIVVLGGLLAAIGPVLLVLGSVAGAIGNIVALKASLAGVFTTLAPLGTALSGALATVGTAITGTVIPALGAMGTAIWTATAPILPIIAAIAAVIAIGVLLYKNWDKIKEKAGQLKSWISEKWDGIKTKTAETWNSLKEKTSEAWGKVKETVEKNGGGIKGAAILSVKAVFMQWTLAWKLLDKVTGGKLTEMKNKAVEVLKDLPAKMFQAGKDIVAGLLRGIVSLVTAPVETIRDLGRKIKSAFQSVLGIESPSTEFAEYGENINEGLASGVEGSSDLSVGAVEDVAAEMEAAMEEAADNYNRLGDAIATALKRQYEEAAEAHTNALDLQIDAAKESADAQIEEIDRVTEAETKALDERSKAVKKASEERIKQYDREYQEQLKIIDREAYEAMQGVQSQIDALDALTAAEEKSIKEREDLAKIAELEKRISEAKTAEERKKLETEKQDFLAQLAREKLLEQRELQKADLQEQIKLIEEAAEAKRTALEEEVAAKKEAEQAQTDATLEALAAQIDGVRDYADARKESVKSHSEAAVGALEQEREAVQDHYAALMDEEAIRAETRKLLTGKRQGEIMELLRTYNPQWQDVGKTYAEMLEEGINGQLPSMAEAVNEALTFNPQVNTQPVEDLNAALGETQTVAGDAAAALGETETAAESSTKGAEEASTGWSDFWEEVSDLNDRIGEKFYSLDETAGEAWGNIKTSASEALAGMAEDAEEGMENTKVAVDGKLTELGESFDETFPNFRTTMDEAWANIETSSEAAWGGIKKATLGQVLLMIDGVRGDHETLQGDLGLVYGGMVEDAYNMQEDTSTAWEKLGEASGIFFGAIKDSALENWNEADAYIDEKVGSVVTNVEEGMAETAEKWSNGWDTVNTTLGKKWGEAQEFIDSLPARLEYGGKNMIDGLKKGADSKYRDVLDSIGTFTADISNKFMPLVNDLFRRGQDAFEGFKQGLESKIEAVKRVAGDLADAVMRKIRNALETKSPSRVMRRIGIDVGDGFALGIESSIGAVEQQAKAMAATAHAAILKGRTATGQMAAAGAQQASLALKAQTLDTANLERAIKTLQNTQAGQEVHLHIGTLIADRAGLAQLERQLRDIRLAENTRLGGAY